MKWTLVIALNLCVMAAVLIQDGLSSGCLVDELNSVGAASNFFRTGRFELALPRQGAIQDRTVLGAWHVFTNGPFTPGQSIGFAASWMSGLFWNVGGSLWWARLGSLCNHLLLISAVSFLAARRLAIPRVETWAAVSFLWLLTLSVVPYTINGISHSLGESPAALWLVIGFLAGFDSAFLGALSVGVGVWLAKLIFLPVGLAIVGFHGWRSWRDGTPSLWRALGTAAAGFVLPQFAWLLWIALLSGPSASIEWVEGWLSFIKYGQSGLDGVPHVTGLINRLRDPGLEWVRYEWKIKLRIVALLLIPPVLLLLFARRRERPMKALCGSLALCSLLYGGWYFLWHPTMWLRHVQPALMLGWSVIAALVIHSWAGLQEHRRAQTLVVVSVILSLWELRAVDTRWAARAALRPLATYASTCVKTSAETPMDDPLCACR